MESDNRYLRPLGQPKANEVRGDPRDASTWRMVRYVNQSSIDYYVFGIPYHANEPIADWNQWFIETAPHNISEMAKEVIEEMEEPDCPACQGTGEADSGGSYPNGEFINIACPDCWGTGKLTDHEEAAG